MLNRNIMNAVLSTLGDSDVEVPEGTLYAGLMSRMNLDEFRRMLGFFHTAELISRNGFLVRPTAKLLKLIEGFKVQAEA